MIAKPYADTPPCKRLAGAAARERHAAGLRAEAQMHHYLVHAFGPSEDEIVFHNLRLVSERRVAQIDHLVLHRFGFAVIESKSVNGTLTINDSDEVTYDYGGNQFGRPSPINQVKRQGEVLLALLKQNTETLRPRGILGQYGFWDQQLRHFVAVSDRTIIRREGSHPPAELMKADAVVEALRRHIAAQRSLRGLGGFVRYTVDPVKRRDPIKPFGDDELTAIRDFLVNQHTSSASERSTTGRQACRRCKSTDLALAYTRDHHLRCVACRRNLRLDRACPTCFKETRVREADGSWWLVCDACPAEVRLDYPLAAA